MLNILMGEILNQKNKGMNTLKNYLAAALMFTAFTAQAQVYKTSTGVIKFNSTTSAETIDATNSQVTAAMDAASGAVEFSVPINSFQFKKALMQKHFQENYMESSKYPKSTFKGTIQNNKAVNYQKDGTYNVTVKGKLTMHGVTKDVTIPGKVVVAGGKVSLKADFTVNLDDYNIKVPANNAAQINKNIKVSVDCTLVKK